MTKLLFICSRNRIRSLTAERMFHGNPLVQARSAGTQPTARIVVTAGHLGWAEVIFCMEKRHLAHLRRRYPDALMGKRVVCLHILDEYTLMEEALCDVLRARLAEHLDAALWL